MLAGLGCAGPAALEKEIVAASLSANSLEDSLGAHPDRYRTREAVVAHYRQGFSQELAVRLAAHSWDSVRSELRAADFALARPETVVLITVSGDRAEVIYPTPRTRVEQWREPAFMIEQLRREDGRWRVTGAHGTSTPPAGTPWAAASVSR